jgi:hypothetical protein
VSVWRKYTGPTCKRETVFLVDNGRILAVVGQKEVDELRVRVLAIDFSGGGREPEKPAESRACPEPDAEQEFDPYRLTWTDKLAIGLLVIVVAVDWSFEWAWKRYVRRKNKREDLKTRHSRGRERR